MFGECLYKFKVLFIDLFNIAGYNIMKMYKTPLSLTYFNPMMFSGRFGKHLKNELIFRTDNNAYSRKSQRGLFHGRTHGGKYKKCFSDKRHRYSQKPNANKKMFYSEILDKNITLPATARAIK